MAYAEHTISQVDANIAEKTTSRQAPSLAFVLYEYPDDYVELTHQMERLVKKWRPLGEMSQNPKTPYPTSSSLTLIDRRTSSRNTPKVTSSPTR